MRRRSGWALVIVLGFLAWQRLQAPARPASEPTIAATASVAAAPSPAMVADTLPPEVWTTLHLVQAGGPFPYERDGVVFGNFERRLPPQPRGYYHEYTVPTPGATNRGARRLVTGGTPPVAFWYSGDHYATFQRIEVTP